MHCVSSPSALEGCFRLSGVQGWGIRCCSSLLYPIVYITGSLPWPNRQLSHHIESGNRLKPSNTVFVPYKRDQYYTDKKGKKIFRIYMEIQKRAIAWLNICAFLHILVSPSSYMTLQPIPPEFSYICGNIFFFFISGHETILGVGLIWLPTYKCIKLTK